MSKIDFNAFNQGIVEEFRANQGVVGGPFEGAPMILVTHKGARSGVERTSPLVHTRDGDDVEIGDDTYVADAEILTEGPERQRLYDQQAALMPNFAEYQEKTTRVIPVVVLRKS